MVATDEQALDLIVNWATALAAFLRECDLVAEVLRRTDGKGADLVLESIGGPGQPTVFELAAGPEALTALAAGTTTGKLALQP
ncbi:hypothetical protein [Nocardia yamanashiensis]|uniref:hypothetical protein n=1 Tax=Nocardia yamanashiensis TaxID=209247 RepID=UPI0008313099|nr:hypothetical protein [Nocardia yamanashiensis]